MSIQITNKLRNDRILNILRALTLNIFALLLSACGTIGNGTHQTVQILSDPLGAKFTVLPSGKTGSTPAKVELKRSSDHEIRFEHAEYPARKIYVRRTLSRGAAYSNSFVPFVGIIGLGIDAATGAQFNLVPNPINVDLKAPVDKAEAKDYSDVVFFNGNKSGTVQILFNTGERCVLKKNEYATRRLMKGAYDFEFSHWDFFKFTDKYQIEFSHNNTNIAVFSSAFGTHFALENEVPKGFEEVCSQALAPTRIKEP